jgi:hypothetical protein
MSNVPKFLFSLLILLLCASLLLGIVYYDYSWRIDQQLFQQQLLRNAAKQEQQQQQTTTSCPTQAPTPLPIHDQAMQGYCTPEKSSFIYVAYIATYTLQEALFGIASLRRALNTNNAMFNRITIVADQLLVSASFFHKKCVIANCNVSHTPM